MHRVPVESALPSARHRLLGVVAQSDLLRLLTAPASLASPDSSLDAERVSSALHVFLEQPIASVRSLSLSASSASSVVTVGVHASAVQALWTMRVARVGYCAVVDVRGALLASLSASALWALSSLPLSALLDPLAALLPALPLTAALAVTASSALSVVVWKMALYGTHCVWLIDSDQRPIRAITMTDVIAALVDWTERDDDERK